MSWGQLFRLWQVRCAACGMKSPVIQRHYASDAEKELRAMYSWKRRLFGWWCQACAGMPKDIQLETEARLMTERVQREVEAAPSSDGQS